MKKVLWMLAGLAAFALLLVFGTGSVDAKADGEHTHCVCGGTGTCLTTASTYGHEGTASATGAINKTFVGVGSATEFNAALAAVYDASSTVMKDCCIYLTADFTLNGSISNGTANYMHVYVCLNGHTLKTANNGRFATVYVSGSTMHTEVSICDCQGGGTIESQGQSSSQGKIITLDSSGAVYLYGGTLAKGKAGSYAGTISVGSRKMYMYGGTVSGGTATSYAGNINVGAGQLRMYGGMITGGTATSYGGNLAVGSGKFYMYGGVISNGTSGSSGGNVYLSSGTIEMYGGSIQNGTSGNSGGGNININGSGKFKMTGGTLYGGDSSYQSAGEKQGVGGGNVRVNQTGGTFEMSGGLMYGGYSGQNSNGYVNGNCIFSKGIVKISGDAKIMATNVGSYALTNQDPAARMSISGNPVLVNIGTSPNMIQVTSSTSELSITGGIFKGFVTNHGGTTTISGGCFGSSVSQSSSGTGSITLSGGYYSDNARSSTVTLDAALWEVDGSAWIPFERVIEYPVVTAMTLDETAGSPTYGQYIPTETTQTFTAAYALTTCDQITGRNMTLNENLDLGLFANVDLNEMLYKDGDASGKISVSLNGETREAALTDLAVSDAANNIRKFSFEGVTPELMGDDITVTLYASNGTTVLDTKTYTIKEYLLGLLADNPTAELTALVNDLLVYGGQAQIKFNHNTANLVSDGIAGSGRTPDGNIANIYNKTAVTAANYQDASVIPGYFKEATVVHENINWIRVKFIDNADDGATTFKLQKGDGAPEDVTATGAFLCTDGLMPTEYGTKVTVYAYRGGEVLSKVEYSMNSYCVRKHSDAGHEFSDALYNYGVSASAYLAAQ